MAERKWGAIGSGATFETLATTIVFFKDPSAALFGRRGKDGGQDARSGDGTLVYQAKFHAEASAAKAIADAKKEAAKIAVYKTEGHARAEQWKGVLRWRLVTNAAFNPTDRELWDAEVVPLFSAQGLVADYWERENLNALLDKYPEIHRSFFEGDTRAFLSMPELRERMPGQELFLVRDDLGTFFGREDELASIGRFLASDKLFLVVHGAGGMGKTRLAIEAAESASADKGWQVLWANVASMTATASWFEAVVPERPTVLLVDEPQDEALLQRLAEQLGGRTGRLGQWKVLVSVRSPKDPVVRFLRGPQMKVRVEELEIRSLKDSAAEGMCADLLGSGPLSSLSPEKRAEAAKDLSRRFSRHPIWLRLAVHALETKGNLSEVPSNAKDLADFYLTEIEEKQKEIPPAAVRQLIRWVALVETVNRVDDAIVKVIADALGVKDLAEVRRRLATLVARRALIERGALNRFVELKPDVLRDHVLLGWLSVDIGYGAQPIVASDDAKKLVAVVRDALLASDINPVGRAILVSLARTEVVLRVSGTALSLLDDFFDAILVAAPSMTATHRIAVLDVLDLIAGYRPAEVIRIIAAMRSSTVETETIEGIFGKRTFGQDDVVLALAWPLLSAAMGAQTPEVRESVLRELCAITEAEAVAAPRLKYGLPNDGKRAASLVERVLEGGPQFWGAFDEAARTVGGALLEDLATKAPGAREEALLKALVIPAMAIERRQTWADRQGLTIQTFSINANHPGWVTREALLSQIKGVVSSRTAPFEARMSLWRVFAESHRNVNQACRRDRPEDKEYYKILLADLKWAREVLSAEGVSVEELKAARQLWQWHLDYDDDATLKEAAEALESLYVQDELAAEFEPLMSRNDWREREPIRRAKADALAAGSSESIAAFVERCTRFLGRDDMGIPSDIAWILGQHAPAQKGVRDFIRESLSMLPGSPRAAWAIVMATSWIEFVRAGEGSANTSKLVSELLDVCGDDRQRVILLGNIYARMPGPKEINPDERDLMRSKKDLFLSEKQSVAFVTMLARTIPHEWPTLKGMLEQVLLDLPKETRQAAATALVDATYWAVHERGPETLPPDLGQWLLDQLLVIPDLGDVSGMVEWHLREIIGRVGPVAVTWLPGALAKRMALEASADPDTRLRALGPDDLLSKYVRRLEPADVTDAAVMGAVDELLERVGDEGSVGYYLPDVLNDIDPDGLLVPSGVAARLQRVTDVDDLYRLARIGGSYVVGTKGWREIATAAVVAAAKFGEDGRRPTFPALAEHGVRTWSSKPGEVPDLFKSAVLEAKSALDREADAALRPFWEWRLARAEADLKDQEEKAKEDRGE